MPRGPRLDAPGVLHHVMGRGIEGAAIFRDDLDRDDFVTRLQRTVDLYGLRVYAWALMPNHFHMLAQTTRSPLQRAMRSLLSGYAGRFNRRHRRAGHLFQNRFKSIVCEKDRYFLELVRYIHLNPIRAGIVADLVALDSYAYTGHAVLVGRRAAVWQDVADVLRCFGNDEERARRRYHQFVADRLLQGRREDLSGGGLVLSAAGWKTVQRLRRGREAFRADERILGSSDFTKRVLLELPTVPRFHRVQLAPDDLIDAVSLEVGVDPTALRGSGGRSTRRAAQARAALAFIWFELLGRSCRDLGRMLGIGAASISRATLRGRGDAERWKRVLRRALEKRR